MECSTMTDYKNSKKNNKNSKKRTKVFEGCVFIISRTHETSGAAQHIRQLILCNGGHIVEEFSQLDTAITNNTTSHTSADGANSVVPTSNKRRLGKDGSYRSAEQSDRQSCQYFFVQSYLEEDDDRLALARQHSCLVVGPDYLEYCQCHGYLADFKEYALLYSGAADQRLTDEQQPWWMKDSDPGPALFDGISEGAREEEEQPQTYYDFVRMPNRTSPTSEIHTIYLVPLINDARSSFVDKFKNTSKRAKRAHELANFVHTSTVQYYQESLLPQLAEFMESFFCHPCKVLEPVIIERRRTSEQENFVMEIDHYEYMITSKRAQHSSDIFQEYRLNVMEMISVLEDVKPADGVCILGVTNMDIYEPDYDDDGEEVDDNSDPKPIMGRATGNCAGIVSLPAHVQIPSSQSAAKLTAHTLRPIISTLVHETMHIFGIDHCTFYRCIMNAIVEADEPDEEDIILPLCPIDLRKLQHSFGFNVEERYRRLSQFYQRYGFKAEANWIARRLETLKR